MLEEMKCLKCDGKGIRDNPKWSYVYPYNGEATITCKHCKGTGFQIGNYNEVIQTLQVYYNIEKDKTTKLELRDIIDVITKASI